MEKMRKGDIDVLRFAEMLCYLEPHPPVTGKLDRWRNPYTNEKAHMCLWFGSQKTTGSGRYTREKPNSSAKLTYNRLLCPGGMLWIAEVLGETPEKLKAATMAAIRAESVYWRNRGKGFRDVIPFERIYELYMHPEGWLYDKRLVQLIGKDTDGYPLPANEEAYWNVLDRELN